MKHHYLSLLAGLPLIFACRSNQCKVEGYVENAKDGDTLFIARMDEGKFIPSDTIIIKDGRFQLNEDADSTVICTYYYSRGEDLFNNIFFLEKGNIRLDIGSKSKVSGTENNDIYQTFIDSIYRIHEQMDQLYEKAVSQNGGNMEDFQGSEELSNLDKKATELIKKTMMDNLQKPAGFFIFISSYNMYSPDETISIIEKLPESYRNQSIIKHILTEAEQSKSTATGQHFIDVTIPSIDGKEIKLSEIISKNKLTLIDCWASWCGPCRAEMPNVVELYKKYKSKGLEIIGISFDEDAQKWKDAIKTMNMTWPQLSELRSWDNKMTELYGVTSIPYTILINQDGIIVGKEMRGNELDRFIADFLK